MSVLFSDRADAGRRLAASLKTLAGTEQLLVFGLPRGGVPVAVEVASALGAPLEVLGVRKLGVPGQEELAMGAVASGGVRVLESEVIDALGISPETIEAVAAREVRELERRDAIYRKGRPLPDLSGATVVLVDDGVATGSTMLAAIRALRQHKPAAIVAAAPAMSASARTMLSQAADACVTLTVPEPFYGVGASYLAFPQLTDAEVLALLAPGGPGGSPVGVHHGGRAARDSFRF